MFCVSVCNVRSQDEKNTTKVCKYGFSFLLLQFCVSVPFKLIIFQVQYIIVYWPPTFFVVIVRYPNTKSVLWCFHMIRVFVFHVHTHMSVIHIFVYYLLLLCWIFGPTIFLWAFVASVAWCCRDNQKYIQQTQLERRNGVSIYRLTALIVNDTTKGNTTDFALWKTDWRLCNESPQSNY